MSLSNFDCQLLGFKNACMPLQVLTAFLCCGQELRFSPNLATDTSKQAIEISCNFFLPPVSPYTLNKGRDN